MIKSEQFEYCVDCKKEESHKSLVPIGEQVFLPGKSRSKYTFYQCSVCGHVWQHIEDSGLGGHGSFYSRLTKP